MTTTTTKTFPGWTKDGPFWKTKDGRFFMETTMSRAWWTIFEGGWSWEGGTPRPEMTSRRMRTTKQNTEDFWMSEQRGT